MIIIRVIMSKIGLEEYMLPFFIMFSALYIMGVIKLFPYLLDVNTAIIYIAIVALTPVSMYLFLRLYQGICNKIGMKGIYNSINDRHKK